jgi:DNA-binding IclR family transcriptional regulator
MRLLSVSKQEIERIHAIFDENVIVAVVNNFQLYLISRLQSTKRIQIVHSDGPFIPHVTAGGKAILAFLPAAQLKEYFKKTEWKSFTSQSMTEKGLVMKQLEEIQEKGYAINWGEYEEEIIAIAAPIFENEEVIAALIVQFPTFRYREEELYDKAPEVIATAVRIGKLLKQK